MGFFFSSNKYPTKEHQLSRQTIEALVSRTKVNSLDGAEEGEVEEALDKRRGGDGKISLQQIYESLLKLKNQNKISPTDKDGLMRVFQDYFITEFGD